MGNYPSMGSKGGTVVGALELNLCKDSCCMCAPKWASCCPRACCPGVASPAGPEWDKAQAGFTAFLEEAYELAIHKTPHGCCGCHDVFKIKATLDGEWTARADAYLAEHGLQVEVCAFYTSDGKSTSPHLVLQFSKKA